MNLNTFENEISPVIFQRGENYYLDNAVADLQEMGNGQWFAIVEGSNDYEVDVRLGEDDDIQEYYCDCPYDGEICKHVVAVLLKIKEEIQIPKETVKKAKKESGWKKIINTAPETELRKFVLEYATKNREFRNSLSIKLSEYDSGDNYKKYRGIVSNAFHIAGGSHGFIDYYHSHAAMNPIYELLQKADCFFENNNHKEVFNIVSAITPECVEAIQYMDDSNGECGGAISDSFNTISKILESGVNESLKNEIFEWLLQQAYNPDYNSYGCADELEPLLVDAADIPDKINKVHKFLDQQLKNAAKAEEWSKEYRTQKYLQFKTELYKKSGENEKAEKIITDNIRISEFREIIVNEQLDKGNYKKVIQLIEDGIKIAIEDNYSGIVTRWKEKLLDIYKQENNILEIKKYASELFFNGHYEMEYYRILKSTYSSNEWLNEKENIISRIIKKHEKKSHFGYYFSDPVATIYIEEGMWDRLFNLVKQNPRINILLNYTQYLKKSYSSELVEMYKLAIMDYAEKNTGRGAYIELVNYIKKMLDLQGGKEQARLITSQLLEKYKNRPAMKDEFRKL